MMCPRLYLETLLWPILVLGVGILVKCTIVLNRAGVAVWNPDRGMGVRIVRHCVVL